MSEDTIIAVSVVETDFGEKVVLESPFEAKDHIKHLPWKEHQEEVREHGSLKGKAESRGVNTKTSQLTEVFDAMEQYGFSNDFATHVSWDPDAIAEGSGAWTIDVEAFEEAKDFFEFCGYSVEVANGVEL
jgi:hypothetical protein